MREDRIANLLVAAFISLVVFGVVGLLRTAGILQPFEMLAYDLAVTLRAKPTLQDSPVVLITITEQDIRNLGGWPLSDDSLANVLTLINSQNPAVIGVDIYRDVPVAPGTEKLTATLVGSPNIVAIYKFASSHNPGVGPPSVLAETERIGFSDFVLDAGGVVRRGLAFLDDGEAVGYGFALRLALAYLDDYGMSLQPSSENADNFVLGSATFVPLDAQHGGYVDADSNGYQFIVDFTDAGMSFQTFSMQDVLLGRIPVGSLSGRIVLLGVDAVSVNDAFATPFSQWAGALDSGTAGVAIHGVITDQLVRAAQQGDLPMEAWSEAGEIFTLLLACLLAGLVGIFSRSALKLLGLGLLGSVLFSAAGYWLFIAGTWLPLVSIVTGWLASLVFVTGYLVQLERRDRSMLEFMFAAQTSDEVAQSLWMRRREFLEEGRFRPQSLPVTVMFVDLGGFTGISEQLGAETLVDWINEFMATATQVVVDHGGVVDDYFGDGIKVNFGVPFARDTEQLIAADASAAVACALVLEREVERLNGQLNEKLSDEFGRQPRYFLRVGINSGDVVLGGLGNAKRQKYTSIGDAVNVAARLEALGKEMGLRADSSIMLSGATAKLIGDKFPIHDHGEVTLRGRSTPVAVFEVVDESTINEMEDNGHAIVQ